MKNLLFIVPLMIFAANSCAEIITLKDGTRVEGAVEGDMDGMKLIKTRYGSLTINGNDILSIGAPEIVVDEPYNALTSTISVPSPAVAASTEAAAVPAQAAAVSTASVTASTMTVAASTETVSALPDLPPAPKAGPEYTFKTVTLSTMSFEKVYFEGGVIIATETFDSRGELLALTGLIKDGFYREYYENGNLKTEKTVINAKTSGTLKAYYPSGVLQSEAYYLQGKLSGAVRIYNENAKLLFEQNFKDGLPDGWFREFDEAGAVKSELFYTDGHAAEKPIAKEEKKAEPAGESTLTATSRTLARGERISFYLNNKYVAKLQLDKYFNIIAKNGKIPDGAVKVYGKTGNLEKELFFLKNELISLKAYDGNGRLTEEYAYQEGQAVKK
ncbi:MAG: toxin-antitoxin system YwqK family antitoxin, partial [Elusimicrobia bacterium]|nr:toxin-antitoxin system YwqK family antitoxin [Elusimicrobiota bacterium]